MNVFEDLIEELKEENLIEESVMDSVRSDFENNQPTPAEVVETTASAALPIEEPKMESPDPAIENETSPMNESSVAESVEPVLRINDPDGKQPYNENDFYRRRAMEEVSSLQMVERVFSGVEREQMKVVPKSYDDIAVSKALHDFLQVSKTAANPETSSAEFKLMQETESWYSSLSHRDQNILPAHLRRYCETTKPVLSWQALVALARFYRNSPYSEAVRSKFDMIATRLFSQDTGSEKRELAFEHHELVQHLSELYADWSSIPLYVTDDDTELSLIVLKFEDFITEVEIVGDFEQLISTDFFNRLRAFKESTGEKFYAPEVTATAVKCNIRTGNRYVELLNLERKQNNASKLEDKYSHLLDQTISDAASKTLQLVHILNEKNFEAPEKDEEQELKDEQKKVLEAQEKAAAAAAAAKAAAKKEAPGKFTQLSVNKWLLALTIIVIAGTFVLYTWVTMVTPQPSTAGVQTMNLDGYYFKDYLKLAKITDETMIGIVNSNWSDISDEKKQEVFKNILIVGKEKGFKKVQFMNKEGKTIGYASANNITVGEVNSNSASK